MTSPADPILLIFAYHFPPDSAIGAARPFRFFKYLPRLGVRCQVFTAAEPQGSPQPGVEHIPDPFVAGSARGFGWQFERAVRKFLLPGITGTEWSWHACRAARKFIRANAGARMAVFSTFPPLGAHLAAWQLARKERLPWIADFRDPIAGTVTEYVSSFQSSLLYRLEKKAIDTADVVVANTDAAMATWQARHPRRRQDIHLIWNGFDPEDRILAEPLPAREYKVLSHVGELYHGRTVAPLIESIDRLITGGRLAAAQVRVRLVGPAESGSLPAVDLLQRAQSSGWLELVTDPVPQAEARRIARTSDTLLLVQPQSKTQVPGKLYEYLQIGRPILAFILLHSPIERVLERSGVPYLSIYPDSSPAAIDDAISAFWSIPSAVVTPSAWFEEQFDARNQAQTLYRLIEQVLKPSV